MVPSKCLDFSSLSTHWNFILQVFTGVNRYFRNAKLIVTKLIEINCAWGTRVPFAEAKFSVTLMQFKPLQVLSWFSMVNQGYWMVNNWINQLFTDLTLAIEITIPIICCAVECVQVEWSNDLTHGPLIDCFTFSTRNVNKSSMEQWSLSTYFCFRERSKILWRRKLRQRDEGVAWARSYLCTCSTCTCFLWGPPKSFCSMTSGRWQVWLPRRSTTCFQLRVVHSDRGLREEH